ncbi:TetR/AcrR family transcriptional regulator [Alteromonas sp. W364]|uniref:TetR/AcrR family transcriptional regulator n=1 Tax=Alteromonas sp. W364 TaxID=3075610 RepID=UPI002885FC5D|nr:TetR/AcrR family transcriptional regulator [Alteromonas sp. W364]MDT0628716.1 TetR/AcrR family transcriptional regulator [Alteromonas sp. W364]
MSEVKKSRSQQKREDILNAALKTFKEQGVQATSMDQLAETANVSKRTVYNYFDSKETLVLSLLHEMWEQFMLRASVEYTPNQSIESQLALLIEAETNMMCDHDFVTLARLAMGHFFYSPAKMKDQMDRMRAQETTLHRWLKAAIADGKFAIDDVDYAAEQIGSLLKGTLFWPTVLCNDDAPSYQVRQHAKEQTLQMFMSRYAIT